MPPGIKLIRINAATGTRAGGSEGGVARGLQAGTAPPDSYSAPAGASPAAPAAVPPDADRAAQAGGLY